MDGRPSGTSLFYASVLFRKGRGRKKKKPEPALEEDKDDDAVTQEIYRRGRGKRMAWEMGGWVEGGCLSCKARV